MKWIASISFLIIVSLAASLSIAESDKDKTTDQPFTWSRFWHDLKDDWVQIGKDAKATGTDMGRTIKDEFKEMPNDLRKGMDETKRDVQEMTGVDQSETVN